MKQKLAVILMAILFMSIVPTTWAFQIERPDCDVYPDRLLESVNTDYNASVGLAVDVYHYGVRAFPTQISTVDLNVSMACNTRMGIKYAYENDPCSSDWAEEDESYTYQSFTNCGDDWGTWVDLPDGFRFKFYGGEYENVPEESKHCKVWVCSNGFISFDLSNSTTPYRYYYSFPNPASPNAFIAPLWTDLVIDTQSKIVFMGRPWYGKYLLVILWKNALYKPSPPKRLTFAVALEAYAPEYEGKPYLYGGYIRMAYLNVTTIDTYFIYGVEDHEGRRCAGKLASGNELGSLNGKTLVFHQDVSNYFIKHLMLTFEDESWPNVTYSFDSHDNYTRGMNVRTKAYAPPEQNENKLFWKTAAGAVGTMIGVAGMAMRLGLIEEVGWVPVIGPPISFALLAWGLYDLYNLHQYNSIEWLQREDSFSTPNIRCAYIKVAAISDAITDASLNVVFYWILGPPNDPTAHHKLNTTAIVEYEIYETAKRINVTTSVDIELGPDDNNSFDTADPITSGNYGEDPMLWLSHGGNDVQDFYKVYANKDYGIWITMMPPAVPPTADFDLYLYNPTRTLMANSTRRGGGLTESIVSSAGSTGWYYIKVVPFTGSGFYNMSVTVQRPLRCPFVYTWNGEQYILDNNLLPTSPKNNRTDVEDYYNLEQTLIPKYKGTLFSRYSLKIGEFENEHSCIDQVKLLAVDHNPDLNIAVTPDGEIVSYWQPLTPISCMDKKGNNQLDKILSMDGNISNPSTYFYGQKGDYLILNFGQINAENAKLILRDDYKCDDPPYCCIEVQVLKDGEWQTVDTIAPRAYWATEAINLSEHIIASQPLIVRLYWTLPHRLDYVGLDTSPQDQTTTNYALPISAIHSTQGDVTRKLLFNDQVYAELIPNEQITLNFILPNNPPTKTRTFILYVNGHYYTITK